MEQSRSLLKINGWEKLEKHWYVQNDVYIECTHASIMSTPFPGIISGLTIDSNEVYYASLRISNPHSLEEDKYEMVIFSMGSNNTLKCAIAKPGEKYGNIVFELNEDMMKSKDVFLAYILNHVLQYLK